jgi:general stress protein YciG
MAQDNKSSGTSNRGFASMDPALQRQIASKGGRSVPPEERSFSKDRALAAEAGRKGGEASHGGRRNPGSPASGDSTSRAGNDGNSVNDRDRPADTGQKGGIR